MHASKIILGKFIADDIKADIKSYVDTLKETGKRIPHLVVILVGDNPASVAYVNGKNKDCQEVGIKNTTTIFKDTISQRALIEEIEDLNEDDTVDGILVQLPLPSHIDENAVINAIDPSKDVDGFHPINVGNMYIGKDCFLPCTPKGIMSVFKYLEYDLTGKRAVVIGRSNIVGKPIAKLLMDKNATVTICHSKTKNIIKEVKRADIVVAAIGQPKMINSEWIKKGAIVIDVGINRDENGRLCGDVDLDDVIDKVKYITPVPGGIGLLTRASLLENTIESYMMRG